MRNKHNNKTESMQLRLTPEMHSFIMKEAADRDISAPEFVRVIIKNFKQKMLTSYTLCIIIKNKIYKMYEKKGVLQVKNLNKARVMAGVEITKIADALGVSYVFLAKIFKEEICCPKGLKDKIKIFLIKNYTECIERL